jgi:hypothetical protein
MAVQASTQYTPNTQNTAYVEQQRNILSNIVLHFMLDIIEDILIITFIENTRLQ